LVLDLFVQPLLLLGARTQFSRWSQPLRAGAQPQFSLNRDVEPGDCIQILGGELAWSTRIMFDSISQARVPDGRLRALPDGSVGVWLLFQIFDNRHGVVSHRHPPGLLNDPAELSLIFVGRAHDLFKLQLPAIFDHSVQDNQLALDFHWDLWLKELVRVESLVVIGGSQLAMMVYWITHCHLYSVVEGHGRLAELLHVENLLRLLVRSLRIVPVLFQRRGDQEGTGTIKG